MSSYQKSDYRTVSKWTPRNSNWIEDFKEKWGKRDSDEAFQNKHQQFDYTVNLIDKMNNAIDFKIIKIPDDLFDREDYHNTIKLIDMIWYGGCYYGCILDDDGDTIFRKFYYGVPPRKYKPTIQEQEKYNLNDELYDLSFMPIPQYSRLIPRGKIADDTLAVQCRIEIPIWIAFNTASYSDVIIEGKFVIDDDNKLEPKFTQEEFNEGNITTNFFHIDTYDMFTEDYKARLQKLINKIDSYWTIITKHVDEDLDDIVG